MANLSALSPPELDAYFLRRSFDVARLATTHGHFADCSAGTFVAGRATQAAAEALTSQLKQFAASLLGENSDPRFRDYHLPSLADIPAPKCFSPTRGIRLGRWAPNR